jgi:hypothetical protein
MIQLRVEGTYIDLYDNDPPKLNFSIEDIFDTKTKSVFSRTFRVPASASNETFFTHAFEINGIDFDVTKKYSAEVLVNGYEFRKGHIRLNKIYRSHSINRIDYEIIFLGETRDFASAVGSGHLCELDGTDLVHGFGASNVVTSWDAFDGSTGTPTSGLVDGNVIYPMIDHGNTYDSSGGVVSPQSQIRDLTSGSAPTFVQNSHPLQPNQLKPMIRAKWLVDKIFEDAGYTYTSDFFDSDRFLHMYVSAFGNTASPTIDATSTENLMHVTLSDQTFFADLSVVEFDNIVLDPGSNYNISNSSYVAPLGGTYDFNTRVTGTFSGDEFIGGGVTMRLRHYDSSAGTTSTIDSATYSASPGSSYSFTYTHSETGYTLGANDRLYVDALTLGGFDQGVFDAGSRLRVVTAPGNYNPIVDLDCDYKKIDFFNDLITMFRLVVSPNPNKVNDLIIEPWKDYIANGNLYDWTHKVDIDKDWVIEPTFFTQKDRIEFRMKEDGDFLNELNIKEFKEPFGSINFDSQNELLNDTRKVELKNIAPSPVTQIHESPTNSNYIIPHTHQHDTTNISGTIVDKHDPIKPKTRIMFYNGKVTWTNGNHTRWYLAGASNYTYYPKASYWEDAVPNNSTLHLHWQVEPGYQTDFAGYNGQLGASLYDVYWSSYVASLYSPRSRRLTCYVELDDYDLRDFSFDDVIFIKDAYYYVESISDVAVGTRQLVKCVLIKLVNYQGTAQQTVTPPSPEPPVPGDQSETIYAFHGGNYTYPIVPDMTAFGAVYTIPSGTTESLSEVMTYMIKESIAGNPISGGGFPDSYEVQSFEGPPGPDSFQSVMTNFRFEAKDYNDHYYLAVPQTYTDVLDALFTGNQPGAMRQVGLGENVGARSAKEFAYNGIRYYLFRLSQTESKWARIYSFGGEMQLEPLASAITIDTDGLTGDLKTGIGIDIPLNVVGDPNDIVMLDKADYHFSFVAKSASMTVEIHLVLRDINGNEIDSIVVSGSEAVSSSQRDLLLRHRFLQPASEFKKGYRIEYELVNIQDLTSVTFEARSYFKLQFNSEANEIILPGANGPKIEELGYLFQGGRTTYPLVATGYLTDAGVYAKYQIGMTAVDNTSNQIQLWMPETAFSFNTSRVELTENFKFGLTNDITGTSYPEAQVFDARGGVGSFDTPMGIISVPPSETGAPVYLFISSNVLGGINPTVDNWYKLNGGALQTAPQAQSFTRTAFPGNPWYLIRLTNDVSTAQTIEIIGSTPV